MATPHKLTLIPYLQRWDPAGRTLTVRLLGGAGGEPPRTAGVRARRRTGLRRRRASPSLCPCPTWPRHFSLSAPRVARHGRAARSARRGASTIDHPDARAIFTAIKAALSIPDTPAADTFTPSGGAT